MKKREQGAKNLSGTLRKLEESGVSGPNRRLRSKKQ
jgi:hypothetical protein